MKTTPVTVRFFDNELEALDAYGKREDLSRPAAVHDLVILGLRVPRFAGMPRPSIDALDTMIAAAIHSPQEKRAYLEGERKMVRRIADKDVAPPRPAGPKPADTGAPTSAGGSEGAATASFPPPPLGYDDASAVLVKAERARRINQNEEARRGGLDAFFDGIFDEGGDADDRRGVLSKVRVISQRTGLHVSAEVPIAQDPPRSPDDLLPSPEDDDEEDEEEEDDNFSTDDFDARDAMLHAVSAPPANTGEVYIGPDAVRAAMRAAMGLR